MIKTARNILLAICVTLCTYLCINWFYTRHVITTHVTYHESYIADKIHNEESYTQIFTPMTVGKSTTYVPQTVHHDEEFIFVIYSKEIDEMNKVYVDKETYFKYDMYDKYPYTETKMKFVW